MDTFQTHLEDLELNLQLHQKKILYIIQDLELRDTNISKKKKHMIYIKIGLVMIFLDLLQLKFNIKIHIMMILMLLIQQI